MLGSRLHMDAWIASQPHTIRACIQDLCRDGVSFEQIRTPDSFKGFSLRNSLICKLGHLGLPLWRIALIAGVDEGFAQRVLEARRKDDVRVRTMRWERA